MKQAKTGIITKILLLCFAVYFAITLLSMTVDINEKRSEVAELRTQQTLQQAKTNGMRRVVESIRAQSPEGEEAGDSASKLDDETVSEIAREDLGLVAPGERIFYIVNK